MATTKIWTIKDNLSRIVDYVRNPEKTELSDLYSVLHYAADGSKTVAGTEKTMYVTGVNCGRDTAFDEMQAVKERFGKTGGNVAYHAYQSFKTGEVTPELCHRLGVELAKRMWGSDYQVLVATHFNTGTYHNHFTVNSVNMWTGRKYDCSKREYFRFRRLSDELCAEHGLTVIEKPKGKTPRSIYFAEKNGEPTKYNLMREAIDRAISVSITWNDFTKALRDSGYILEMSENRKYPTIRSVNSKKPVRMYHLGEQYEPDGIADRLARGRLDAETWHNRARYQYAKPAFTITSVRFRGSLKKSRVTGLRALYYSFLYQMGILPKNRQRRPYSPEMREALRRLESYSAQNRLVIKYKLDDIPAVEKFISDTQTVKDEIAKQRTGIYNKMRRCSDPERMEELKAERDKCTAQLKALRQEMKTAGEVIDRHEYIRELIRAEQKIKIEQIQSQQKNKSRMRGNAR